LHLEAKKRSLFDVDVVKKFALPTNYSDNLREGSIAFYFNTRSHYGSFFWSHAEKK